MDRDRLRIFKEFRSRAGAKVLEEIEEFLGSEDQVDECQVAVDESESIQVRIMLKKFSFLAARETFIHLSEYMRRSYFNVYICEETDEGVRYLYLTGIDGWDGIKMDVCLVPVSNEEIE